MARSWFAPWGWTYRPTSWQGWSVAALAAGFCAQVFAAVDRHSRSASDTLYGVFPYVVSCLVLVHWIAGRTGWAARRVAEEEPTRRAAPPAA